MLTEIEYTPTDPAELAACLQRYHAAIRIMASYLRQRLVELETAQQGTAIPYQQNSTQSEPVNNLAQPGGAYEPNATQDPIGVPHHQPGDIGPSRPGHLDS